MINGETFELKAPQTIEFRFVKRGQGDLEGARLDHPDLSLNQSQ